MTVFSLVEAGFGTKREIEDMDSDEFLDLVEYVQIRNAIQRHEIEESKRGR